MRKKIVIVMAAVVIGVGIIAAIKLSIRSDTHIPGGMELTEHTAEQNENESAQKDETSVRFGEDKMFEMMPEVFSSLGEVKQIEITFPKKNTIFISGVLPVQNILDALQKQSGLAAQSCLFLLQQESADTVPISIKIICSEDSTFYIADITCNGLAIPPELWDTALLGAFQTAFLREAEKSIAEIHAITVDLDGIHVTGSSK